MRMRPGADGPLNPGSQERRQCQADALRSRQLVVGQSPQRDQNQRHQRGARSGEHDAEQHQERGDTPTQSREGRMGAPLPCTRQRHQGDQAPQHHVGKLVRLADVAAGASAADGDCDDVVVDVIDGEDLQNRDAGAAETADHERNREGAHIGSGRAGTRARAVQRHCGSQPDEAKHADARGRRLRTGCDGDQAAGSGHRKEDKQRRDRAQGRTLQRRRRRQQQHQAPAQDGHQLVGHRHDGRKRAVDEHCRRDGHEER